VHIALATLSSDQASLDQVVEKARRAQNEFPGVEVVWRQDCYQLPTGRTSFGFKDGIGQPAVEGAGTTPSDTGEPPIKAGEFILGYPDETGAPAPMPTPDVLGRNGTYVVFRKLHTRVAAYRRYLRERAAGRREEALLGAKMVGRWQSGAPLALTPSGMTRSSGRIPDATTTSATATTCAGSSARQAPTPGAPTRATLWTTRTPSTYACTA
jgi:deferrochelatase/peroxidase EfeB